MAGRFCVSGPTRSEEHGRGASRWRVPVNREVEDDEDHVCSLAAIAGAVLMSQPAAQAKGCIKGAIVGGIAGHYAGHHGLLGAAAGCAIGRHEAKKRARERAQQNAAHGSDR